MNSLGHRLIVGWRQDRPRQGIVLGLTLEACSSTVAQTSRGVLTLMSCVVGLSWKILLGCSECRNIGTIVGVDSMTWRRNASWDMLIAASHYFLDVLTGRRRGNRAMGRGVVTSPILIKSCGGPRWNSYLISDP